jgi:hypothetical protein
MVIYLLNSLCGCGFEVPEPGDDVEAVVFGLSAAATLPQDLPVFEPGDDVFDAGADAAVGSVEVVVNDAPGVVAGRCGDGVDAAVAAVTEDDDSTTARRQSVAGCRPACRWCSGVSGGVYRRYICATLVACLKWHLVSCATIRRECFGACGKGRTSPSLSTADLSRFSRRFARSAGAG